MLMGGLEEQACASFAFLSAQVFWSRRNCVGNFPSPNCLTPTIFTAIFAFLSNPTAIVLLLGGYAGGGGHDLSLLICCLLAAPLAF